MYSLVIFKRNIKMIKNGIYLQKLFFLLMMGFSLSCVCACGNDGDESIDNPSKNTTDIAVTGFVDSCSSTYAEISGYANLHLLPTGEGNPVIGIEINDGLYRQIANFLEGNHFSVTFEDLHPSTEYRYRSFVKYAGLTYYAVDYRTFTTDSACNDFPRMSVRFTCSLQQSPYSFITMPGQFLTVTKKGAAYVVDYPGQPTYTDGRQGVFLGFGGLILGKSTINMDSSNQYVAYDRACPVEAEDLVISRLTINTNCEGKCPKCGTVYDLDSGFPKQGDTKKQLKIYTVHTTNTSTGVNLIVCN